MSVKTRMRKQQAIGVKTRRDAAPVLVVEAKQKSKNPQVEVRSVLPLLTERLTNVLFADTADWNTFVATTKQFQSPSELAEIA